MEYRPLGRTGVQVSQLCLGAMMFGPWGNPDHDESIRIIHTALDAGINFVDTADFYSAGESEEIVGKALAGGRRDDVVLATKVGLPFGENLNHRGTSRRWITQAVEHSLRRLGTDWIDLYQVHRLDPATDLDETLGALSDLVHAGKIRAFGASTVPASQIVEAQWVARAARTRALPHRAAAVLAAQPRHRARRAADRAAARDGRAELEPARGRLAVRPLPQGRRDRRAGRRRASALRRASTTRAAAANAAKLDAADALGTLADEAGLTLIQLAIAFVVRHPGVTSAIIGPRTMAHLESLPRGRRRGAVGRRCWTASTRSSRPA